MFLRVWGAHALRQSRSKYKSLRLNSNGMVAGPLAKYNELVAAGNISEDPQQLKTLQSFHRLYVDLLTYTPEITTANAAPKTETVEPTKESFWGSLFSTSSPSSKKAVPKIPSTMRSVPKGIYVYGGVGCG